MRFYLEEKNDVVTFRTKLTIWYRLATATDHTIIDPDKTKIVPYVTLFWNSFKDFNNG